MPRLVLLLKQSMAKLQVVITMTGGVYPTMSLPPGGKWWLRKVVVFTVVSITRRVVAPTLLARLREYLPQMKPSRALYRASIGLPLCLSLAAGERYAFRDW